MAYAKHIWSQLKNLTSDHLVRALEKDGWIRKRDVGATSGSILTYVEVDCGKVQRIVHVHWHSKKTYGPRLLKTLLADIGWSEDDLRRLKLIK